MHRSASRSIRSLFAAAVLACCATAQAQPAEPAGPAVRAGVSSPEAQQAAFRDAMRLHRTGRWSAAYGRFVALADQGHRPAARVALGMLRHSRAVYGNAWSAAPSQVAAWERAVGTLDAMKVAVLGE